MYSSVVDEKMLKEYNSKQDVITLYCDNMRTINIYKNEVKQICAKHIDIRHHFIRELVEKTVITLDHLSTENQLADMFIKALDVTQFKKN